MIDTRTVRQFSLTPAEATWVMKTMTRALERSLNAMAGGPGGLPAPLSTLYRQQRQDQSKTGMEFSGRYPEALAGILAHHESIPPQTRLRLVALMCAHWNWFAGSSEHWDGVAPRPPPGMWLTSPYQMAHASVFGSQSIFQSMNDDEGPLTIALRCHQARLGRGMDAMHIGPYHRMTHERRTKGRSWDVQPRQVGNWFASKTLPKVGWFLGPKAPETLPPLPVSGRTSEPITEREDGVYPWSDHVILLDYLIYQFSRTAVICIQTIRSEATSSEDATAIVKALLAVDPRAPS